MSESTPESENELFDLYDAQGVPLGIVKSRPDVHRDGDWHRSVHIWFVNAMGQILFQRRALDKDTWPGRLDSTVGGHYRSGESDDEGIAREIREEIGLDNLDGATLIPVGVRRVESREPRIIDREFQDTFIVRVDRPLEDYQPDPAELHSLTWLDASAAASLHAGKLDRLAAELLVAETLTLEPFVFRSEHVIPDRAAYLQALVLAVDDLLEGRTPAPLF